MKFRVLLDAEHCIEVTGYEIPNNSGIKIFAHKDTSGGDFWLVSEAITGMTLGLGGKTRKTATQYVLDRIDSYAKVVKRTIPTVKPVSEKQLIPQF